MEIKATKNKLKGITKSNFVSLIPLRGGSKGIPRKNLLQLNGSPLFAFTVKASLLAGLNTYMSSEDLEIKETCQTLFPSVEIIDRPSQLAQDSSSTEDVIKHFLEVESKYEHVVLLQATSPLTRAIDIEEAIAMYLNNSCIPLVSVVRKHSFFWDESGKPLNYKPQNRPRRQDWKGVLQENGAIYIFSREHFNKYKCRASHSCTLFEMQSKSAYEIDEMEDLNIVASIMKGQT